MAPKKNHKINRLPIKIQLTAEDLETADKILLDSKNESSEPEKQKITLASSLQTGFDDAGLYIDTNPDPRKFTESESAQLDNQRLTAFAHQLTKVDKLMEKSVLQPGFEQLKSVPAYEEGVRQLKRERRKEAEKTKGSKWYNLPATEMTDEKLRDLEIIQMRAILNPKKFYKKNDLKVLPKYFQVGTVVDGPAEFYSNRVPRKDRKKTLVDELMADASFQRYNKRKYAEIIKVKQPAAGGQKHQTKKRTKKVKK